MTWPFGRGRRDRDLRDEVAAHLEQAARDRVERGEDPAEARAAVRREFGNVALVQEITREMWGRGALDRLLQDVRVGMRALRRSPVFTLAAVVSLALGIGANTAIFAAADALMWRSLPVPAPDRLQRIAYSDEGDNWSLFTYPSFAAYRTGLTALADVAAICDLDRSTIRPRGWQEDAPLGLTRIAVVSGNYFSTLGVTPRLGRLLGTHDDDPSAAPAVVMSASLWRRRFAAAPDVLGRSLDVNGVLFTVIGVAQDRFVGDWIDQPVDLWFPASAETQVWIERPGLTGSPTVPWLRVLLRLHPESTPAAAAAAANTIFRASRSVTPDPRMTAKEIAAMLAVQVGLKPIATGYSVDRASLLEPMAIIAVIAGLVLVIACANVANLLLARATNRAREMAVRQALGASRLRLLRHVLTESLLLAAAGGGLAILVGWWGTSVLARVLSSGAARTMIDVRLDWRLLAFAAALSIAAGVIFGLAPARRIAASQAQSALTGRSPDGSGAPGRRRLFQTLVVVQVLVSLVLIATAGLFVRTLQNLKSRDLGIRRDHLLLVWIPASEMGGRGAAVAALFRDAASRVAALPGVVSASPSTAGLLGGNEGQSPVTVPGHTRTDDEDYFVQWNLVAPRFFATTGMTLLAGRDFGAPDSEHAPRVAIVNETMARTYWGRVDVVGQRFGMRRDTGTEIEIVGVVADAVTGSPREPRHRMIYLPYEQDQAHLYEMCLAVRTSIDPPAAAEAVRQALLSIDPRLPISSINTLDVQLDRALSDDRLVAGLSGAFGVIALILTCAGLYGVTAYLTARRATEIGIRMALGASRGVVLRGVLLEALGVAALGVAAGVPATLVATRLITARLFGIQPADPVVLVAAAAALVGVALAAAWLPARRATRIDPMTALRAE